MESYIKKILGVSKLNEMKSHQLDEQELTHQNLSRFTSTCGETIANMLLKISEVSRNQQRQIIGAKFSSMTDKLEIEVKTSLDIYKRINTIINDTRDGDNLFLKCATLQSLAKTIEKFD
jgi:hypothetical protein